MAEADPLKTLPPSGAVIKAGIIRVPSHAGDEGTQGGEQPPGEAEMGVLGGSRSARGCGGGSHRKGC